MYVLTYLVIEIHTTFTYLCIPTYLYVCILTYTLVYLLYLTYTLLIRVDEIVDDDACKNGYSFIGYF